MQLDDLKAIFAENGCSRIYVKVLAANDNSKNQVYLGDSFEILNIFPIQEVETVEAGVWERERFKTQLGFSWITDDHQIVPAPRSQLILYPKYPEVRFSGFLLGCKRPPSELMTQRLPGRLLFLSVAGNGRVLGYVAAPETALARQFANAPTLGTYGVFYTIDLPRLRDSRSRLLHELRRIHRLGWIVSKRLNAAGQCMPCNAPNCGGYTLEAELGITPNGYSEPDFLGWEVKQFGVRSLDLINASTITLMTPEPTHGFYREHGVEAFVRKYGYPDHSGIPDRMNFGGVHKFGVRHPATNLEMRLLGFDRETGKIRNSDGRIALIDRDGLEAAAWSFASLLLHWNRKHNQACYVPSQSRIDDGRQYRYGSEVLLGSGTDFQRFLAQMAAGTIYYDPGIKLENMSTAPRTKRRSQFRIRSAFLNRLYGVSQITNVEAED